MHFFYDTAWKYNWLDFFLLFTSVYFMFFSETLSNVSWLRMLRMLRLAKALRVFRLIAMFKTIRAILKSIIDTIGTLCFSLLLLLVIHFLFGLVFVLRTASYFRETGSQLDPDIEQRLVMRFGSVWKGIVSLFMCGFGGDTVMYYETLGPTGLMNQVLLLFFIAFTQIAVMNIILGVFVDHAMKSMMSEKEEAANEHAHSERQCAEDLRILCEDADVSKEGWLSPGEWNRMIRNPKFHSYLHLLGFRVQNVCDYFRALSGRAEDGSVDLDEFVRGCMRLKGTASCFDMQTVLVEVRSLRNNLEQLTVAGRLRL